MNVFTSLLELLARIGERLAHPEAEYPADDLLVT